MRPLHHHVLFANSAKDDKNRDRLVCKTSFRKIPILLFEVAKLITYNNLPQKHTVVHSTSTKKHTCPGVCEIEIDVILACDVASTVLQSGHHLPGLLDEVLGDFWVREEQFVLFHMFPPNLGKRMSIVQE